MTALATPPPAANSVHSTPAAVPAPAPSSAPANTLWPMPLPVVGVTGEYKAGKTLFLLSIDPAHTLYYDTEKSAETYEALGLGFKRVDVWKEMLTLYPKGHKPIDLFLWWWDQVRAIEVGRYTFIGLDTASEIESGLVDWVDKNPQYFGHTQAQYQKMDAIKWGDVKELWKAILANLASRCVTFGFAVHMTDVWSKQTKQPTGKRKPKGKETLMELASLYLHLERKPSPQGAEPQKPSAVVIKHRLVKLMPSQTDELEMVSILPLRIPVATPYTIRQYMLNPAGARDAKPEELAPIEEMTDDDRLRLQATIAEAQRDTESIKLEQQARRDQAAAIQQQDREAKERAAAAQAKAAKAGPPPQTAPYAKGFSLKEPISEPQKAAIVQLKNMLGLDKAKSAWLERLKLYGVESALQLSEAHAAHLQQKLEEDFAEVLKKERESSDRAAQAVINMASQADQTLQEAMAAMTGQPTPATELAAPKADPVREAQLEAIVGYKALLKLSGDPWKAKLTPYGVTTARELTADQADALVKELQKDREQQTKGGAATAAPKS